MLATNPPKRTKISSTTATGDLRKRSTTSNSALQQQIQKLQDQFNWIEIENGGD